MPIIYFQTTQNPLDLSPYILKHSNNINSRLADNLFRKKLYETPKKDIPALLDFHYQRCDEPSEFADHVIELLEVALDENQDVKFLKSLSFFNRCLIILISITFSKIWAYSPYVGSSIRTASCIFMKLGK